jgi:hypothetical protein
VTWLELPLVGDRSPFSSAAVAGRLFGEVEWNEEIAASAPFTFYFTSTHRGSETLVR